MEQVQSEYSLAALLLACFALSRRKYFYGCAAVKHQALAAKTYVSSSPLSTLHMSGRSSWHINFSAIRNAEVPVPPDARILQPTVCVEGRLPQGTFSIRVTLLIYQVS
jgi:hypothetical protein